MLLEATFERRDITTARDLYKKFKKEIKKEKLRKEDRYKFSMELAERFVMEGMFKHAIKMWGKAYFNAPSKMEKLRVLNETAFCYMQLNRYLLALLCYKKILRLSKRYKIKEYYIKALYGLGEVHSQKRKFKKALKYYNQVISVLNEIPDTKIRESRYHRTLLDIFVCYYQLGDYTAALDIYNKINPRYLEPLSRDNYYGFRGHMEYKLKNYEEAFKWYKKAFQACNEIAINLKDEKLKQINEKQKEYWQYWLKECEEKLKETAT